MTELSKAFLQELDNQNQPARGKQPVPVQFNPSSLRLQYANQSEGGRSAGRQARQHTGNSSVTLSVDLVFDTADEGSTAVPRSVLERTRQIEAFITPQARSGRNQAPPRLRFQWGDVIVDGVLESLSVDIDHFAHNGTPLRAKASLSIKGQDAERQAGRSGSGANTAVGAPAAGAGAGPNSALPGSGSAAGAAAGLGGGGALGLGIGAAFAAGGGGLKLGPSLGASIGRALEGESLASLAMRNGLAPEAWRALGAGVSDPSRLPAGKEVALPQSAQANPGVGSSQGVQAGTQGTAPASAAQRVGLTPAPAAGALGALQTGYAMAAAGGLGAALETVRADAGTAGATQARRRFEGAGGSSAAGVDALTAAASTPGQRQQIFSLRADTRAQTFGRSVPLRDRVLVAQDERANLLSGQAALKRQSTLLPPTSGDPGVPGWVALPTAPAAPRGTSGHPLGCRCGCGH